MFSQRNNPYCELISNCTANIKQIFFMVLRFSVKWSKFYFLYLEKLR
jgi:hypothetical protein